MSAPSSPSKPARSKDLTKEEELLLKDASRNVSTKSSALFYGNAAIVAAIPICKSHLLFLRLLLLFFCFNSNFCLK
jgi:hypothetical protein